jgi:isoquinoline 1-oxidoreductase beta subunit
MQVTRRGLLVGAAVGGGLLVAWGLMPRRYDAPLQPGEGEHAFGAWLKIGRDGVVTVAVPQLEMGQGVTTLIPQIVAMELGADWRQVAVEPAPVSGAYANVPLASHWAPLWMPFLAGAAQGEEAVIAERFAQLSRFTSTAAGTSLAAYEAPARAAAAAARAMLCMAAADRWNAAWEECEAAEGFVTLGDRRVRFGELAEEASAYDPPDPPPLRTEPPRDRTPAEPGQPAAFARLDAPAKVDGTYLFAGDVRLPGIVYAAIRHAPLPAGELTHLESRRTPGLVALVKGKRWLAAVAENWWAAEQALDRMEARFTVTGPLDSEMIDARLERGLTEGDAVRIATRGDGDSAMGEPSLTVSYEIAPALHATLETASATARLADGKLELWLASQAPEQAREAAAKAVGLNVEDVVLYPMPAGGSFDRRLEHDHAIEVASIAREVGRPVQLVWSRWQEALAGRPRAPAKALLSAKTASDGSVAAWRARVAMPPTMREMGARLFDNLTPAAAIEATSGEADPLALEGAVPLYAIPNVAIDHVPVNVRLPTGRMRGGADAIAAFMTESFVDELASRAAREPLGYRIAMLGDDPRMVACLQAAARLAQWDAGRDQSGQGLACHRMTLGSAEGRIACIATARAGEGGVRVLRLSAAVDIGRIVNRDLARQQIEGGLILGMALATGSSTGYLDGLPLSGRLGDLALPRLADCPEIAVTFLDGDHAPFDPGELGVAVAAPAIANALHSATGLRLRRLPLLSEGL